MARQHDSGELSQLLTAAGVPSGVICTVADLFADPLCAERQMLLTDKDDAGRPIVMPGIVPKSSRTPGAVLSSCRSDLHNREVYGDLLRLNDADLTSSGREELCDAGVCPSFQTTYRCLDQREEE